MATVTPSRCSASSRSVSSSCRGAVATAKPLASGRHTSPSDTSKPGDASCRSREARVVGSMERHESSTLAMARWLICTPLGLPVLPLVNRMVAGAASGGAAGGAAADASAHAAAPAISSCRLSVSPV